jgi:RNA polymerase sigma-70 factor (ECF subfamily)
MTGFAEQEQLLAALLRAANQGDQAAYRRFLDGLVPFVRTVARRSAARNGSAGFDVEDAVQETILAIHLKRHTWRDDQPIGPWIGAITRYKLVDEARRRGRRQEVEFDDSFDVAAPSDEGDRLSSTEMDRLLGKIGARQRAVVSAISIEGISITETAGRLGMSEGAVRVTLHRGLKALAAAYRRITG